MDKKVFVSSQIKKEYEQAPVNNAWYRCDFSDWQVITVGNMALKGNLMWRNKGFNLTTCPLFSFVYVFHLVCKGHIYSSHTLMLKFESENCWLQLKLPNIALC